MESDRFICVREEVNGAKQVVIVDLADANNIMRRPISAEAAIMAPKVKVLALRAGRSLQLFNVDAKQKVTAHTMDADVIFWKWITDTTIGIVTDTSVFHWNALEENVVPPVKVFERHQSLQGHQIINYRASSDGKWLVLVGISAASQPGAFKVKGSLQLYSRERGVSQPIEGHAASFAELRLEGSPVDSKLFTFAVRTAQGAKLHVVEIDHQPNAPVFAKKSVDVFFPPEAANDFPVSMQVSKRFSIVYMVTKYGFIHLYDLETGACIYMNRISGETIFVTTEHEVTSGIIGVNRKGQVLSVTVDENTIIPYILSTLSNPELAVKLAGRGDLPGADDLYIRQFQQLFSSNNYTEAAKVAARSPRGILRTPQIIEQFKTVPAVQGQLSPILTFFGILLESGKLNEYESLELARPVLAQQRKQLLEKWLREDKLSYSEALGDLIRPHDMAMAMSVYLRANVPNKTVAAMADLGQVENIIKYAKKASYQPDYASLLQHITRQNPDKGAEFAGLLVNDEMGPLIEIERVTDVFLSQNMIQQATSFLLDALKENRPDQGPLQTRLLEMNLVNAPQVADAILGNDMFTHYDRPRIANLCEKAGLLQRALEHYDSLDDIKRVVVHTNLFQPPEWLVNYFGKLTVDQTVECLREMLKVNIRQNLTVVVQVATKYSDLVGPGRLIELFEQFKTFEGLYYYLGGIVNLSQDSEVQFKYIQAATRTGQIREVERICRESNYYNPEKVKNFLKEAKLSDQLPLIIVCDRFDMVQDLVLYLYQNGLTQFIEVYVQQVNSTRTPQVVGGLLDVDCDESTIKALLASIRSPFSVDELVDEVEKRNRLKLIQPWLDARVQAGQQDPAIYNALAKIAIDSNTAPESFLKENNVYDPLVVGKYCEKRDPYLAYIAYAKGMCDDQLIAITNDNAMYKHQARYLVKRRQLDLWGKVLSASNDHRRALVDQVVNTAVPESTNPDDVSLAVKAFIAADLPSELIELLEKIVLEQSAFSDNANLKRLLMLTAIRSDKGRVMGYIDKLDGYDVNDIAPIAIEHQLYEETFSLFRKNKMHLEAITVLVEYIVSIDRGVQFATTINEPAVWSRLAKAQLDGLRVKDAIESYIRADDPANYAEVIETASRAGKDDDLVRYLQMARKTLREPRIDTQLAVSYAKTDRLHDMEEFLAMTNVADQLTAGEQVFEAGMYQAARLLFSSISNWARLATTLIYIGENQAAVDAARKAGNTTVWRQVNMACLDKKEFKLAQICGLNLIVHAEELQAIVRLYENRGYFDEIIAMLEAGLGLERAHMGLFTELAILYAKHRPDQLMDHLKLYHTRINMPKVIRVTEEAHLWTALVFLYAHYQEYDNAALTILQQSADAWDHELFKQYIVKVSNLEIYYRALSFYLNEAPTLLSDLLTVLTPRIDHARVVGMFRKSDHLPLVRTYLVATQHLNVLAVNEAMHDLLIEEEDYQTLRDSIEAHDNFNQLELARRLSTHDLLEFRRVAATLYGRNQKHEEAIALSKQDKLYKDAIDTAAASADVQQAEDLLRYFVQIGAKELFSACLFTAFDHIRPDVVSELSWRHGLDDFAMPYRLQRMRHDEDRLANIEKSLKQLAERASKADAAENDAPILGPGLGGRLMITGGGAMGGQPPGMMPPPQMPMQTGFGMSNGMF